MSCKHAKVIILGSGPAGLTAAGYCARAKLETLVFTGPEFGGQIAQSSKIENFPSLTKAISGYELIQNFKKQSENFGASIINETVLAITKTSSPFCLNTISGEYSCDALIVACGCSKRSFDINGENELFGFGVSTCATCDGAFFKELPVTVVGHSEKAAQDVIFLTRFAKNIIMINPKAELSATPESQLVLKNDPKVTIYNNSNLTKIIGNKTDGVQKICIKDTISGEEKELTSNAVFFAIGYHPNSELFTNILECNKDGYIITKPDSTACSVAGIFACGDIRAGNIHQVATAVGTGCMAATEVCKFLKQE